MASLKYGFRSGIYLLICASLGFLLSKQVIASGNNSASGKFFYDWVKYHNLEENQSGLADDPANDGIPNLLKFAFGINPTSAIRHNKPSSIIVERHGESRLAIDFPLSQNARGLDISVEASVDLEKWCQIAADMEVLNVANGNIAQMRAFDHQPISDSRSRFLRLVISETTGYSSPSPVAVSRVEKLNAMLTYFGQGPSQTVDPMIEEIEVIDEPDHRRIHLRYLVDADEYSYAYLMLPLPLPQAGEKRPLILALHPTSDIGKNRVAGIYDGPPANENERKEREARQYALDLVRLGFVVFAPDRAAFGQRRLLEEGGTTEQMNAYRDFLATRYPGFRLTSGKNVWDLQRALDFLVDLPFVDQNNIGAIGHSLGAWDSIMLSGMDERIRAAVVNSGGMINFKEELWTDPNALRAYLNGPQGLTENVNVWMMLTAPRSLLYIWSLQDALDSGGPHLLEGYTTILDYWDNAENDEYNSANGNITALFHGAGHDFPPEARAMAYRYLIDQLGLSID